MNRPAQHPLARTKIVATLGPASDNPSTIAALVAAGADVFRLNMAHGDLKTHRRTISIIRDVTSDRIPVAILVDLAGPKLRLGKLAADEVMCDLNRVIRFVRGTSSDSKFDFVSNYQRIVDDLEVDDEVLLADGAVNLVVQEKQSDHVACRVVEPGIVRSRQGIHLPNLRAGLPALTSRDKECVLWAASQSIDYLSLSFVQSADNIEELRALMQEASLDVPVIAKIEKREALEALHEIVAAANGVMVARGDLGVEIDVAQVPVEQKRIVELCNRLQKPVIVATEMLDSMQDSPRPTRAESADVANAVLDGADACMLSGETAVGKFPVESVATMNRIMRATEPLLSNRPLRQPAERNTTGALPITSAVVFGAGRIAQQLDAKLVVITTRSGATALTKSNLRDFVPTIAVSANEQTLRQVSLFWGIRPLAGAPTESIEQLRDFVFEWGRQEQILSSGDQIVFVIGSDCGQMAHNSVAVHEVE